MTKPSPRVVFREAAEPLVRDQRLDALCELALEFGARNGILSGLFRVAADDVAAPGDRRLGDGEFAFALLARDDERHPETVVFDDHGTYLQAGALAHTQNVLDLLGFEGGQR